MEEFRICTVEAQAATEDLREEVETIINNFTSRHEKVQFSNLTYFLSINQKKNYSYYFLIKEGLYFNFESNVFLVITFFSISEL